MGGIKTNRIIGITIFTIVEVLTMVFWLKFALEGRAVLAVVVLAVGLELEHFLSVTVSQKRLFGGVESF